MIKELYKFTEDISTWTYTNSDSDVVYGGDTYEKIALKRSNYKSRLEISKAKIDIKVSIYNELGIRYLQTIAESVLSLVVYETETETSETSIAWKGRLSKISASESVITLTFESIFTSLRNVGVRKRYQRTCPHSVYNRGCTLDKELFAVSGTVTAVSGLVLTCSEASAYDDNYFTNGIIKTSDGAMRFIVSHIGSLITINRDMPLFNPLDGSELVDLYPGCNKLVDTCNSVFSNILNFGGFSMMPRRNPFDGRRIA